MNVIAINGSPHANGSTRGAIDIMAAELCRHDITVEVLHVGNGLIQGCIGCNACHKAGKCVVAEDVNEAAAKIAKADGLILGSPTYYGAIAGGAKCYLDRLFYRGIDIRGKVAASLTVARRSGGEDAFHQLNSYLTLAGAVIAPSAYWNVIHGHNAEEILRDEEGVRILQIVAENMAWLIKALDATKESHPKPTMRRGVMTNFIR
jgi:multimeric flavodoxin WrbA